MDFRTYLEKTRKVNGEKYLSKTIDLYVRQYDRYENEILKRKEDINDLIDFMNGIIKNTRNPYVKASFKLYLLFLGVDEEDERLNLLKKTKNRASALTSMRVLGEKSIPEKDMEILLNSVEPEWKLIIKVFYETAIRENEFLNIRWKDITLNKDPNSNIGAEIRVLGKGKKFRHVFITKETTNLLMDKQVEAESETDKIFMFRMSKNGKLYARQEKALIDGIRKRTEEHIGRAFSPHSLRHSALQKYANQGSDIMGISSLAGHSNLSTTQVYVKSSKAIAKNMFEKSREL